MNDGSTAVSLDVDRIEAAYGTRPGALCPSLRMRLLFSAAALALAAHLGSEPALAERSDVPSPSLGGSGPDERGQHSAADFTLHFVEGVRPGLAPRATPPDPATIEDENAHAPIGYATPAGPATYGQQRPPDSGEAVAARGGFAIDRLMSVTPNVVDPDAEDGGHGINLALGGVDTGHHCADLPPPYDYYCYLYYYYYHVQRSALPDTWRTAVADTGDDGSDEGVTLPGYGETPVSVSLD